MISCGETDFAIKTARQHWRPSVESHPDSNGRGRPFPHLLRFGSLPSNSASCPPAPSANRLRPAIPPAKRLPGLLFLTVPAHPTPSYNRLPASKFCFFKGPSMLKHLAIAFILVSVLFAQ